MDTTIRRRNATRRWQKRCTLVVAGFVSPWRPSVVSRLEARAVDPGQPVRPRSPGNDSHDRAPMRPQTGYSLSLIESSSGIVKHRVPLLYDGPPSAREILAR